MAAIDFATQNIRYFLEAVARAERCVNDSRSPAERTVWADLLASRRADLAYWQEFADMFGCAGRDTHDEGTTCDTRSPSPK